MEIKAASHYGKSISSATMRQKVYRLEDELLKMPQVDCPVRNLFAPGIYIREMTIPAGTTLTGAEHKTEHINIISSGRITVWTEDGMKEISAPCTFVSQPGTKRVGYAHEDTVWSTIHPNTENETDMDVIVELLTTSKNSDLLGNRELGCELQKIEGE